MGFECNVVLFSLFLSHHQDETPSREDVGVEQQLTEHRTSQAGVDYIGWMESCEWEQICSQGVSLQYNSREMDATKSYA